MAKARKGETIMDFKKVSLIYFSATDVSKKYAQAMGKALGKETVEYDITLPADREPAKAPSFGKDDFVIVAMPIYGGRVVASAVVYLNALKADGTPCVVVGTYGNRHYDDAVVEMEDIMTDRGFTVVGGAAVIGRHSFSEKIAGHRPNADDLEGAAEFIKLVADKEGKPLAKGVIPGNRPYKDRSAPNPFGPSTSDDCINCGLCAKKCPNDVISLDNPKEFAKETTACTMCHRCVTICPKHAKSFTFEGYQTMVGNCIAGFGKPDKENLYFM